MSRFILIGAVVLVLVLALLLFQPWRGSGGPGASPMTRLETESPILASRFAFVELTFNGKELAEPPDEPMLLKIGEQIIIQGRLGEGDWPVYQLASHWQAWEGEGPVTTVSRINSSLPTGMLMLYVHTQQTDENLGLLKAEMVQVRPDTTRGNEGTAEFRVRTRAPEEPGDFVIDLHVVDATDPDQYDRFAEPTKPPGHAIWRCPIRVEK